MYPVLFSLIVMSVLQDSLETVTEFDVIAMLKDTGQHPLVTGSNHWSNWSPGKIIDGIYADGKATSCNCCSAFEKPAWANLDLTTPFLISRFEVLGRTDGDNVGDQFQNIMVSAGRTDLEGLYSGNIMSYTTHLVAQPYPPLLLQHINVSSASSVMVICEMQLFAYKFGELASGVARQSTSYENCTADKAQDGKRIFSEIPTCTCSITLNNNRDAYWEIDLTEQYLIEHIAVTGRTGNESQQTQSQNLVAYIGNMTMGAMVGTQLNVPDNNKTGLYIHLDPPRLARYINIKKSDHRDVMTICEVEVFKTECPCELFGDKCERTCHCTSCCDSLNGQCPQCKPGWMPPTCETECKKGTYGQSCSQNCDLNCLYNHCNAVNGSTCMEGCRPGFDFLVRKDCSVECQNGFYGNCSQTCGKCKSPPCIKRDGECVGGCAVGYFGNRCQLACPKGTYGDNCSGRCSSFCVDVLCDHISAVCDLGCKPGYDYNVDPQCNYPCNDGTYGANCTHLCGHCRNDKTCEKDTGEKEERKFTASEVARVAGGLVGGCLLLLGLVFASVLVYRRYKSASTKTYSTYVIPGVEKTNTGRAHEGPNEMPLKNNDEHIYHTIQN